MILFGNCISLNLGQDITSCFNFFKTLPDIITVIQENILKLAQVYLEVTIVMYHSFVQVALFVPTNRHTCSTYYLFAFRHTFTKHTLHLLHYIYVEKLYTRNINKYKTN